MTRTQRAAVYDRLGGPEVLRIVDAPIGDALDGEVVVAVRAVGITPFDAKVRSGIARSDDPFPRGIGRDFAGTVLSVRAGAVYIDGASVRPGDSVLGWDVDVLRERIVVDALHLARKPPEVPWEVAGSLSTPGQTAQAALRTVPVHEGDTVLVGNASGSVGFVYSQLAQQRGARVIGTSSPANFERLRAIGVVPVAYGEGLVDGIRNSAPDGITAAQDNFGRETVTAALALGVAADRICSIVDYDAVREYGIKTTGQYERRSDVLQEIVDQVADGTLILSISTQLPIDAVRDAFALMESGHLSGRVVVTP